MREREARLEDEMSIEKPYYQYDEQGVYFQVASLTMRFKNLSEMDVLIAQLSQVRAEISANYEPW